MSLVSHLAKTLRLVRSNPDLVASSSLASCFQFVEETTTTSRGYILVARLQPQAAQPGRAPNTDPQPDYATILGANGNRFAGTGVTWWRQNRQSLIWHAT